MLLFLKKIVRHFYFEFNKLKDFISLLSTFDVWQSFQLSYAIKKPSDQTIISFKPKGWDNNISCRNDYRDKRTIKDMFVNSFHLPVANKIVDSTITILDLGANIGATMMHFKNLYPKARIFGYEMHTQNYIFAKANTQNYKNITVVNKAIWVINTMVEYQNHGHHDGYSLHILSSGTNEKVQGITLQNLLKAHKIDCVDYLKMDIEGAEKNILLHHDIEWLNHIKELNIELHLSKGESIQKYITPIEQKGFKVWKDLKHPSAIRAVKLNKLS